MDGQLVLPGLVDMHQHLDKSRTRALLDNPSGTLIGASAAYRALAPSITKEQMIARARRTVEACSAYGTVAIRSHTNIDPQTGVRGAEAMVELRAQCAAFMHIQIVGHVTSGATSMLPESDAWLREAIDLGIDAIGGVPAFSSEPVALLKLLFDSAERSGFAARHAHRRTSRRRQSDVQRNRQDDAGLWHGRPRGRGPLFGPERHGAGRGAAHDRGVARSQHEHRRAAGCNLFCRDAMPIACRRAD